MSPPRQLFWLATFALGVFIVVLVVRHYIRSRNLLAPVRPTPPDPMPAASRTSRIAEALMIVCISAAVLVHISMSMSYGGEIFEEHKTAIITARILLAAVASLAVLFCVAVAWRGHTGYGAVLSGSILFAYGFFAEEGGLPTFVVERSSKGAGERMRFSTHVLSSYRNRVELWVNGVRLGETPLTIDLKTLKKKVPEWTEPPKELTDRTAFVEYRRYERAAANVSTWKTPNWGQFKISRARWYYSAFNMKYSEPGDPEAVSYYARFKIGDEWGLVRTSNGGGGRDPDSGYRYASFDVLFPGRERRFEALLDLARLSDYRVGPDWFKAIETYGEDGRYWLRRAFDSEAALRGVFDDWARWRYELDKVKDKDSAWATFRRICRDAADRERYLTTDVSGRAVELLVDKLPPERLVELAETYIRSCGYYRWDRWEEDGCFQFGYPRPAGTYLYGRRNHNSRSTGRNGSRRVLPPEAFPVAHAVWLMDRRLDEIDDTQPNIIERRVTPAILRWNYNVHDGNILRAAAALGGPSVDRFLLRQDWQTVSDDWTHDAPYFSLPGVRGLSDEYNPWLYLLANLPTETGRDFRAKHADRILEMAERMIAKRYTDSDSEIQAFDFLFMDLDRGTDSLAARFWPRFKESVSWSYRGIGFHYLAKMEPVTTVEMYVDLWRSMKISVFARSEIKKVLRRLPIEKRRAVVEALVVELERDPSNIEDDAEYMVRELKFLLVEDDENHRANRLLPEMKRPVGRGPVEKRRAEIADWLENSRPDHPLVQLLLQDEDPELRVIAVRTLGAHPTPKNRKILSGLIDDPDKTVRAEAVRVRAALKKPAAASPMEYAEVK